MALTFKIKGIKETFDQLNSEINQIANEKTRNLTKQAVRDLVLKTPVDTGYARDSWEVITKEIDETKLVKEKVIASIENKAEYIAKLNAGSSQQAPSRFIEEAVLQYFEPDGVIVQIKKD